MEMLDTALDDLTGLVEAYRATTDEQRTSPLRSNADELRALQREIGAGANAYAAVTMASARGDVNQARIDRARQEAQAAMEGAWRRRSDLARLVEQQRLPLGLVRDDLRELIGLSLQCRAGVAAFDTSPLFDAAAAEPLANKVLVDLREATLTYLARVRETESADAAYPDFAQGARRAAADLLEKIVDRAAELERLEKDGAERDGTPTSPGMLADGLVSPLRKIVRDWTSADASV